MEVIVYNETTGEILRSVTCKEEDATLQCQTGQSYLESERVDETIVYVVEGAVIARPAFDITVTGHVIAGIPEGATVTIEGVDYSADGDDIEFEPTIPGTYKITVRLFPYQDTTVEVTAL